MREKEQDKVRDAFCGVGVIYVVLCMLSSIQLTRLCRRYKEWTMQKWIHVLIVLITICRSFFTLAIGLFNWCDVSSGSLSPECDRNVYYITEQIPNLCFLSLCTLLVVFWAEVYYNAIDQRVQIEYTIKPIAKCLNSILYLFQIGLWCLYATTWTKERHYVSYAYAVLTSVSFLILCLAFARYGYLAHAQMRHIPVELMIRMRKLKQVAMVTSVWTSCFTLRSIILLLLSLQQQQLHQRFSWIVIAVYFGLLEVVPCLLILYYYRHVPVINRQDDDKTMGLLHHLSR